MARGEKFFFKLLMLGTCIGWRNTSELVIIGKVDKVPIYFKKSYFLNLLHISILTRNMLTI